MWDCVTSLFAVNDMPETTRPLPVSMGFTRINKETKEKKTNFESRTLEAKVVAWIKLLYIQFLDISGMEIEEEIVNAY